MINKTAFRLAILCLAFIGADIQGTFGQKPAETASSPAIKPQAGKVNAGDLGRRIQLKLIELRDAGGFPGVTVGVVGPDGQSTSVSIGYSDLESERAMETH